MRNMSGAHHETEPDCLLECSSDGGLVLAFCCFLAFPAFKDCMSLAASSAGMPDGAVSLLLYGILCAIILRAIPVALRRIAWFDWALFAMLLAAVLLSWVGNPSSQNAGVFVKILSMLLTQCLGMYVICRAIGNWRYCWHCMGIASCIIVAMQPIVLVFFASGNLDGSYSQSLAYQTLPAAAYFLVSLFKAPRIPTVLLLAISMALILASGSRGPLLALAILAVVLFILQKQLGIWRLVITFVIVFLALVFPDIMEGLLLWLRGVFVDLGFNTRVLDVLFQGDFFASDERPILLENVFSLIAESPIAGYGIGGDRIAIATAMGAVDEASGYYPHNFFLECLMHYGIVLGGIVCLGMCWFLARAIGSSSGEKRAILLTMAGVGFAPLLVSSSYIGSPTFFMCLGLCVAAAHGASHARKEQDDPYGE